MKRLILFSAAVCTATLWAAAADTSDANRTLRVVGIVRAVPESGNPKHAPGPSGIFKPSRRFSEENRTADPQVVYYPKQELTHETR